jgi:hypothetical protein
LQFVRSFSSFKTASAEYDEAEAAAAAEKLFKLKKFPFGVCWLRR